MLSNNMKNFLFATLILVGVICAITFPGKKPDEVLVNQEVKDITVAAKSSGEVKAASPLKTFDEAVAKLKKRPPVKFKPSEHVIGMGKFASTSHNDATTILATYDTDTGEVAIKELRERRKFNFDGDFSMSILAGPSGGMALAQVRQNILSVSDNGSLFVTAATAVTERGVNHYAGVGYKVEW